MYKIPSSIPVKFQQPLSTMGLWMAAHLPGLLLIFWLYQLDESAIPDIVFIPLMLIVANTLIYTGQAIVISILTKKRLFIAWWLSTVILSVVLQRLFGAALFFLWPFATFQTILFITLAQFIIAKYYGYTMRFWVLINLGVYGLNLLLLDIVDNNKHFEISNYGFIMNLSITIFITGLGLFFIKPTQESKSRFKGLL